MIKFSITNHIHLIEEFKNLIIIEKTYKKIFMINLIFSETKRSLVYLKELYKNKYKLNLVIIYSKKKAMFIIMLKKEN